MKFLDLQVSDGVRRRLETAVMRLSHAYIIAGPVKATGEALAERLSQAFVCDSEGERPCGVCSNCRKVQGGIHPDVIRVSLQEDKRNILVDQVRRLRAEAYIRPNEADRKVFIIEDAQTMNENAQNALLKVLEDGPGYLAFLLLTENEQLLLPTIRSRCEVLSLGSFKDEGKQADPELEPIAREFARLLMDGPERDLVEFTVTLEVKKIEKNSLLPLFDLVEIALRENLPQRPREATRLIEHLRKVRKAALFNVGTGHLLGWLAAGI